MKKKLLGLILALAMVVSLLPQAIFADELASSDTEELYVRTIMMYDCGSNLETYGGMATYNLHQILNANFSKDNKIKFIVMTGGSDQWQLEPEYLLKPSYLETLAPGTHTLTILFSDGEASTQFTIKEAAPDVPETGDMQQPMIWIILAFAALLLTAWIIVCKKRGSLR